MKLRSALEGAWHVVDRGAHRHRGGAGDAEGSSDLLDVGVPLEEALELFRGGPFVEHDELPITSGDSVVKTPRTLVVLADLHQ